MRHPYQSMPLIIGVKSSGKLAHPAHVKFGIVLSQHVKRAMKLQKH